MTPSQDTSPSEWRKHLVTIGIVLVAAVALSAFGYYQWIYPKVRSRNAWNSRIVHEGRLIGNAAQQYFLTTGKYQATFGYNPTTGEITGDLTPWIKLIENRYSIPDTTIESGASIAFSIQRSGAFNGQTVTFSDEGKTTFDPSKKY